MGSIVTTRRRNWLRAIGQRFRSLPTRSEGNAFAEYALLLALLTGGCLAAYGAVSIIVGRGFAVDFATGSGRVSVASATSPSGGRPGKSHLGRLLGADGPLQLIRRAPRPVQWLLCAAVWTVALAAGVLLWRALRRKRPVELEKPAEAAEPLPPGHEQFLFEKRHQLCSLLAKSFAVGSGHGPEVRHLISKQLVAVRPKTSVRRVRQLMESSRIRHLLVVARDMELQGIISDRDVKHRKGRTAAEIMTPNPITVPPDMALVPAITVMLKHGISCLPVVEKGRVRGILTTTDLMLSLQSTLQLFAKWSAESASETTLTEADYQTVCEATAL